LKGWLLDTNVIAEVSGNRPDARFLSWLRAQPEHTLYLSILTLAEYRKGIEHLPPGDKRRPSLNKAVAALEGRFSGRVLSVSDKIAIRWGTIRGEVKRLTGHSTSALDTFFAATAIEHNLYLATRNVVHVAHSGAVVFNPWKDDPDHFPL
jgi:predicted nucleic acid-binding protein